MPEDLPIIAQDFVELGGSGAFQNVGIIDGFQVSAPYSITMHNVMFMSE